MSDKEKDKEYITALVDVLKKQNNENIYDTGKTLAKQ